MQTIQIETWTNAREEAHTFEWEITKKKTTNEKKTELETQSRENTYHNLCKCFGLSHEIDDYYVTVDILETTLSSTD